MNAFILLTMTMLTFSLKFNHLHGLSLYPFGYFSGDVELPRMDEYIQPVQLSFDLPFFNETFRQLQVSTNGVIFIGFDTAGYAAPTFPLFGTKCVAPYWVDCDLSNGGHIFYREVSDPALLLLISNEITSKFSQKTYYRSSWAFIVTFNDVPRYGCSLYYNYSCPVVKHQTIITTNGFESFVIFLYEYLGFDGARVGFNAGDGQRYFMFPNINTVFNSTYVLVQSNVGESGKWIFSISNECYSSGVLTVTPKKVLYFGGQEVTISGLCFDTNRTTVDVAFGQSTVNCNRVNFAKIVCLLPYIDFIGKIPIYLRSGFTNYNSFIITHDESDDTVKSSQIELSQGSYESPFIFLWQSLSNEQINGSILLSGLQEDTTFDVKGHVVDLKRYQISRRVENTGSYKYQPSPFELNTQLERGINLGMRKILLAVNGTVRKRIIVNTATPDACTMWFDLQPNKDKIGQIVKRESEINPCQPAFQFSALPINFELDDECSTAISNTCNFFHPGANRCYRSTNNLNNVSVQCCYDDTNRLMVGPTGGGTLDMRDPRKSPFWHFIEDVLPYILCCKFQSKCDKYYEKRPSINSQYFVPPAVTRAQGDPHFLTIDGTSYDFNPFGEFIFLQAPELMIQVRISQYNDKSGKLYSGSYFSAFAIQSSNSDVVQIETSKNSTLQVKVGGEYLIPGIWNFNSITIDSSLIYSGLINVDISQGVKLIVQVLFDIPHIIVLLRQSLKGSVYGLVGNWDDDPENDFMLPDKTVFPKSLSKQDIHYSYGMRWTTTETTSIFSYPEGMSWSNYQKDFIPYFGTPTGYSNYCQNDSDCIYDFFVTSGEIIGLSNIVIKENVKFLSSMFKNINEICISNVNVSNGVVRTTDYSSNFTNVEYRISCNSGFQSTGSGVVYCSKGKYSKEFDSCYEDEGIPSFGSVFKAETKFVLICTVFLNILPGFIFLYR